MKLLIGIFTLAKNCLHAFFSSLKTVTTKEDCFWTINETFFIGENAKIKRDNFQDDYNKLVEQHRNGNITISCDCGKYTTGNCSTSIGISSLSVGKNLKT